MATRKELLTRLDELHTEAEDVQDKLIYLDEIGSDDFDQSKYDAFKALQSAKADLAG